MTEPARPGAPSPASSFRDPPSRYLLHHLLVPARGRDTLIGEGDAEAIVDGDRVYGRDRLIAAMESIAAAIHRHGVRRGDRVAILLPKRFSECAAIVAASRADAVFVPINPVLKPAQVRHIVADSGARLLITNAALRAASRDALDDVAALRILLLDDDGVPQDDPTAAADGPATWM